LELQKHYITDYKLLEDATLTAGGSSEKLQKSSVVGTAAEFTVSPELLWL
jgi:hypothetical protein